MPEYTPSTRSSPEAQTAGQGLTPDLVRAVAERVLILWRRELQVEKERSGRRTIPAIRNGGAGR